MLLIGLIVSVVGIAWTWSVAGPSATLVWLLAAGLQMSHRRRGASPALG